MTTIKLPKGFELHDGKGCPVGEYESIEAIVRTAEGLGSTGVVAARYHDWDWANGSPEIGDVVGYRAASRGETPLLHHLDRYTLAGRLKKRRSSSKPSGTSISASAGSE